MSIPSLRKVATAASASLLLLPARALADLGEKTPLELAPDQAQTVGASGGGGGSLVRTFVGLAIVIAVIYGLAWVLRQLKASREERTRGYGLSSAAVVALGPGRSLHLVRAGRELVLVGVAEHGVVPIRTYSEEEATRLGLVPFDDGTGGSTGTPTGGGGRPSYMSIVDALRERTIR